MPAHALTIGAYLLDNACVMDSKEMAARRWAKVSDAERTRLAKVAAAARWAGHLPNPKRKRKSALDGEQAKTQTD